jgi:hypothetical protein
LWDKPRDPAWIPEVLEALETRWIGVPDQRLGQVVLNLLRRELSLDPIEEVRTLFFIEDEKLLEMIRRASAPG